MGTRFTEATLEFLAQAPFQGREWVAANRALYQVEVVEALRPIDELVLSDRLVGFLQEQWALLHPLYRFVRDA